MASEVIVVSVSLEQLRELMREAVREERAPAPGLLDQRGICTFLSVGRKKLRELINKGLPEVRLGAQSPRYDPVVCKLWTVENAHLMNDSE